MTTPYAPAPGNNARRQLFTRRIPHGSEESVDPVSSPSVAGVSVTPATRLAPQQPVDYVGILTDIVLPSPAAQSEEPILESKYVEAEVAAPTVHPEQWNTAQLAAFLEFIRVPEAGISFVVKKGITGPAFMEIIQDTEVHSLLEEALGIADRFDRCAVIGQFKACLKLPMQANQPAQGDTNIGVGKRQIAGEKSIQIPILAKPAAGMDIVSAVQWKTYITGVKAWAELTSTNYAWLLYRSSPP